MTYQKSCNVFKNAKSIVNSLEPYGFRCPETQHVCNFLFAFALTFDSYGFRFPFDKKIKKIIKSTEMSYNCFGFKNSGLKLEFRLLVDIGRSGVMIGRLCLNMVS